MQVMNVSYTNVKHKRSVNLRKESSANYNCVEHKRAKRAWVNNNSKTAVYFFCSTRSSGTEGIRGVENFVPLFASYRAFLCTPKPYDPKPPFTSTFWLKLLALLREAAWCLLRILRMSRARCLFWNQLRNYANYSVFYKPISLIRSYPIYLSFLNKQL